MKTQVRRFAAALLATSILAVPLSAQTNASSTQTVDLPAVAIETADSAFAETAVANDDALEAATAREDISLVARSEQASNVSNNSIDGASTTGEIRFSDTAFSNASGLTTINANSGNQVSMNASINVNIVMTPPQQ